MAFKDVEEQLDSTINYDISFNYNAYSYIFIDSASRDRIALHRLK